MTTLTMAYIFIGLAVWSVMMGAMLVHCWMEDISEAEYYALECDQWQRDRDELERLQH
jgi:hypothetical protein